MQSTVITYDFDRLKGDVFEDDRQFSDFNKIDVKRKLDLLIMELQDITKSLQALYGGDITLVETYVLDNCGNRVLISEQPIALVVPYWLSHREIEYIKDIDDRLIVII